MPSFNRDGVKRRIVEVVAAVLPEWDVSYEWPGDNTGDHRVFFDAALDGNPQTDSLAAAGTARQSVDTFTITGLVSTLGHYTAEDAEKAAADAMRTIDTTFRKLRRLKDPNNTLGIEDGTPADYAGIRSVDVSSVTGPGAASPQPEDEALEGLCLFVLTCVSDL